MDEAAVSAGGGSAALTTGWEPENDLPVDDTVLRQYVHHSAAYWASIAQSHDGWVHRHDELSVASCRRHASFFNSATLLQPAHDDDWEFILECVDGVYRHDGITDYYLWSPWPTPDLRERGWELDGHPPLMVGRASGGIPGTAVLEIRQVTDADGLHDWERVVVAGYPLPELEPFEPGCMLGDLILDDDRWRLWVGYDEGRPVSVGTQFTSHGLAQFALGVTLHEARGHGFWYAMVRERLLAEPNMLHAGIFSDDSRPGIEKLGFMPISRFTLWHKAPG
jgi:hypothetical protein